MVLAASLRPAALILSRPGLGLSALAFFTNAAARVNT